MTNRHSSIVIYKHTPWSASAPSRWDSFGLDRKAVSPHLRRNVIPGHRLPAMSVMLQIRLGREGGIAAKINALARTGIS
jgi:hypothetical protein